MRVTAAAAGAVLLTVSMTVAGAVAPAPVAAAPADVVITYSINQDGAVKTGLDSFARKVKATLNDPRGWSLGGHIDFRLVSSDAEMRLVLASPEAVEEAAPGCSAAWSCRVGERVLINDRRWRNGTESWGLSVRAYQHYVVNHEVGHFLGLGHRHCPEPGAPAPVMQQQSIDKEGCQSNVWPRLSELRAAARNQDVPVPDHSPKPASEIRSEAARTVRADKPSRQSRPSGQPAQQRPSTLTPVPTPVQAEATASSVGPVEPTSAPSTTSAPAQATAAPAQTTAVQSARQTLPVILLSLLATLVVAGVVGSVAISLARRRHGGSGSGGGRAS